MKNKIYSADFHPVEGIYLLSHAVGRPLISAEQWLSNTFFTAWKKAQPWSEWLATIDAFRTSLGHLFNAPMTEFCPQTNLSSAVVKVVMSIEALQKPSAVVLLSEVDFPSMGFALQHALPSHCELRFIPADQDLTDANVWDQYLTKDVTLTLISHAYSNTGQLAPLSEIIRLANQRHILSLVDNVQSAGIIPLDLSHTKPAFVIGSCVKWLCGGPGAGYLWVNPDYLDSCEPKDVGWFSHQDPFEFDIHNFKFANSSLKFWGGTPSVVPFAIATQSINYLHDIGIAKLHQHNQKLLDMLTQAFGDECRSPANTLSRSGTLILNFGRQHQQISRSLRAQHITVDNRTMGMRISPHIYNQPADITDFIDAVHRATQQKFT